MACVTFDADEPASMRQERLNTFLQDFDLEGAFHSRTPELTRTQ